MTGLCFPMYYLIGLADVSCPCVVEEQCFAHLLSPCLCIVVWFCGVHALPSALCPLLDLQST